MEFKDSFFYIILEKLQIQWTPTDTPILNNILNAEFLGFNTFTYNLRITVLIVLLIILLKIFSKIGREISFYIKRLYNYLKVQYKIANEKKFNTLISQQILNKVKAINTFFIICNFDIPNRYNKLEIFNEFTKSFLMSKNSHIKYDDNKIIFQINNFFENINNTITQLYLTREIFKNKYSDIKIYSSGTIVEENVSINQTLENFKKISNLKINTKYIICDNNLKFHYSIIIPQIYKFESQGEYLLQNTATEVFTIIPHSDRTL